MTFSVTGDAKGSLHLSGYYQPGPDDDDAEGDEDDEVISSCFINFQFINGNVGGRG